MKIAVCDDDRLFLSEIKNKIYEYSNSHNFEPIIDCYYSGEKLAASKTEYKLIILDYQMDGISGLETAKRLRAGVNRSACIIFLTSYPEIAISAYEVDTYRFVVKNTLYDGLYKALDSFLSVTEKDYDICFKCEGEFITVNTKKIVMLEAHNKEIYIRLSDGKERITKTSLSEMHKKLPHDHFVKTHKAYIINMNYICKRDGESVLLSGCEDRIPVSRSNKNSFDRFYINYLKNNNF